MRVQQAGAHPVQRPWAWTGQEAVGEGGGEGDSEEGGGEGDGEARSR